MKAHSKGSRKRGRKWNGMVILRPSGLDLRDSVVQCMEQTCWNCWMLVVVQQWWGRAPNFSHQQIVGYLRLVQLIFSIFIQYTVQYIIYFYYTAATTASRTTAFMLSTNMTRKPFDIGEVNTIKQSLSSVHRSFIQRRSRN